QDRRPRFSFFHLQLSKNRRQSCRHKIIPPNPKTRQPISISANFYDFFRTRDFVASSAAASRSVTRLIEPLFGPVNSVSSKNRRFK
ncbi:hypothetical protein NBH19_18240, partial [Rhizobium sp. S95]|uniref:hypothetical protein n=1 Tax=Ciceribacter sp. S95 TaxID=2949648 RepID=UPI002033A168